MNGRPVRHVLDFSFHIKDGIQIGRRYGYTHFVLSTRIAEDRSDGALGRWAFEIHVSDGFNQGHKGSAVYSAPFSRIHVCVHVEGTAVLDHIFGSMNASDLCTGKVILVEDLGTRLMRVEDFRLDLPLALKKAPSLTPPARSRPWWKRRRSA